MKSENDRLKLEIEKINSQITSESEISKNLISELRQKILSLEKVEIDSTRLIKIFEEKILTIKSNLEQFIIKSI